MSDTSPKEQGAQEAGRPAREYTCEVCIEFYDMHRNPTAYRVAPAGTGPTRAACNVHLRQVINRCLADDASEIAVVWKEGHNHGQDRS